VIALAEGPGLDTACARNILKTRFVRPTGNEYSAMFRAGEVKVVRKRSSTPPQDSIACTRWPSKALVKEQPLHDGNETPEYNVPAMTADTNAFSRKKYVEIFLLT